MFILDLLLYILVSCCINILGYGRKVSAWTRCKREVRSIWYLRFLSDPSQFGYRLRISKLSLRMLYYFFLGRMYLLDLIKLMLFNRILFYSILLNTILTRFINNLRTYLNSKYAARVNSKLINIYLNILF